MARKTLTTSFIVLSMGCSAPMVLRVPGRVTSMRSASKRAAEEDAGKARLRGVHDLFDFRLQLIDACADLALRRARAQLSAKDR